MGDFHFCFTPTILQEMSYGDRGWGHRAGLGAVGAPGNVAPINGYGAAPEKFTLFVSNVPDTIDDYWLRKMFECVGQLLNITRPRDANGVPKAFGFADYADAESVLRCIEVLHDMRLPYKGGEKHLIVSNIMLPRGTFKLELFLAGQSR
jgi:RNA recognition motif-containing protein